MVMVTVAMVQIRIPKCPDSGNPPSNLPTFDCNNCTVPEPDCTRCPVNLVECRSTFPPDCTQCPTDCTKANSDPLCAPDCSKCDVRCPIDIEKCRDVLDNLYFSPNKVNLPAYARANGLVNNLVEGRFGFSLRFKPTSQYGILCAFIEPTLVLVHLLEGKVRLLIKQRSSNKAYDNYPVDTLVPRYQISTVSLTTSPGSTDVLVTVNATQQTIQAPVPITLSSKMFLGGVPNDNLTDIPRSNFKGCFYEVKSATGIPLDLTKFTRNNVDLGCQ